MVPARSHTESRQMFARNSLDLLFITVFQFLCKLDRSTEQTGSSFFMYNMQPCIKSNPGLISSLPVWILVSESGKNWYIMNSLHCIVSG